MSGPRISLEQWRALTSVVEAGGYAQAAEALHKSQSTLTYAVQKIERLLNVKVFEIRGRKAALTEPGQVLYRRARTLLEESQALERGAEGIAAGWEPLISLAVEIVFPTWMLLECFGEFAKEHPQTHIELYETVLGGTEEMLKEGRVDLAICSSLPQGFLGDAIAQLRFFPVAHPDHALHKLGRKLSYRDLRQHRHIVIRDSGSQRTRKASVEAEQRWTVSNKATSIRALSLGYGFAWMSEESIREELRSGLLKRLPLQEGAERHGTLYLAFADRDYPGRGAVRLAEIIRQRISHCGPEHQPAAAPAPRRKS